MRRLAIAVLASMALACPRSPATGQDSGTLDSGGGTPGDAGAWDASAQDGGAAYDAGAALATLWSNYTDAGAPSGCASNPGEDFAREDDRALLALARSYDVSTGQWPVGWWNNANAVEAVENTFERSGGQSMRFLIEETFDKNLGSNFLNNFYDDEGWWGNAWVRAYDLTGDVRYLQMAETVFRDMAGGWDNTCDGGIWWSKSKTYKNAIANELFLLLAASLHNRIPGDADAGSHLEWAQREWAWFAASGMINGTGLVNDGLVLGTCQNNGGQAWTYNQGVVLGGLVELYAATGDPTLVPVGERIATAATTKLVTDGGILREACEPNCGADGPEFKGIFTRNLAKLYALDHNASYRDFLTHNARTLWRDDRDAQDQLGLVWSGPFDSADPSRQTSAMVTVSAAAQDATQDAPFAETADAPMFCHGLGSIADAGWSCDPAGCPSPGFLMNGPYLASLAPGPHTVHVRLEVDVASTRAVPLAIIDVFDPQQRKPVTSGAVLWSDFAATGVGQDVALDFTAALDHPLEFRVFWGAPSLGPRLTVRDVLVDAAGAAGAAFSHGLGRLDALGRWEADTARDPLGGTLLTGPVLDAPTPGAGAAAWFELKAEPPKSGTARLATLRVFDPADGGVLGSLDVARNAFPDSLYHAFPVSFTTQPGQRYAVSVDWAGGVGSPRLTARGVYVRPTISDTAVTMTFNLRGIGNAAGDANVDGKGYALASQELGSTASWDEHSFVLGPSATGTQNVLAGGANVVQTLPHEAASVIHLLLLGTNGTQPAQPFVVSYTDGSQSTFSLDVPDWFASSPPAGVDFARGLATRWGPGGVEYGNIHLVHAALGVNPGKQLGALTLPNDANVKVLAVTLGL